MDKPAVAMTKKKHVTVVAISGAMTIDRIAELRSGLLRAFGLGKGVQLSLAAVSEVDLTGLQLICSAHRTALVRGLELSVVGCEEKAVATVAREAGMLRHLGCAADTGGTCVWKREN
jgi:anti-anti-sigma regulatory factor